MSKENTELNKENPKAILKHGGESLKVWACISAAGVGNLEFIEGTMVKNIYFDILKKICCKVSINLVLVRISAFIKIMIQSTSQKSCNPAKFQVNSITTRIQDLVRLQATIRNTKTHIQYLSYTRFTSMSNYIVSDKLWYEIKRYLSW